MKLNRSSCLVVLSLALSACSGSSSNNSSSAEAGIGPDLGRLEMGNQDALRGADASDANAARTDVSRGEVSTSTLMDAGPRDAGAGASIDGAVLAVDAAAATDSRTSQSELGRDTGAAGITPTDAAPRETNPSPDTAGGNRDAFISTGNATVDRLAVAAAVCGPQSIRTVPVGWQMVIVGESGCSMEAPASWLPIGAGTPNTFVVEDQTRVTGSSVLAGVDLTNTVTCTPHGVVAWIFAKNTDCVGFKELDWKERIDNVAGTLIPRGDLVYSCTQGGVPVVGYLMVQIHGTSPWCNMLVEAFWMPETQIESRTCTLTQTLNSIRCPQGGTGCDDSQCRKDCVAEGNASGACTSDDSCVCTN